MKKNILVVSIIAVAILITVSFTSVVGYSSVASNSAMNSPLFHMRTSRAIGQQSKDIHRQYITKGSIVWFPTQNEKTIVTQEIVDSIRKMDEKTFRKFIASVLVCMQNDDRFNDVNLYEIRDALYRLKSGDEEISLLKSDIEKTMFYYRFKDHVVNTFSEPFCFITIILAFIIRLILQILCEISGPPVGSVLICPPHTI